MEQEKWVLRGGTEKEPVFWNPRKGWVRTPCEAKKYDSSASALKALEWYHDLEWYHGWRFQKDGIDVIRVTP